MHALKTAIRNVARTVVFRKLKQLNQVAFSDRFLLITNVGISLSLSAAGDILEQQYEKYNGELEKFDRKRTMHMGISGVGAGVVCHYWYKFLDHRLPGRDIRTVIKKIVIDQFICSPVYISLFFVTLGILEHKSSSEIWEEMKDKAWKLYMAEWAVWPTAQFINFYWLSPKYRVFYDNIISLGFDVYVSHIKHSES